MILDKIITGSDLQFSAVGQIDLCGLTLIKGRIINAKTAQNQFCTISYSRNNFFSKFGSATTLEFQGTIAGVSHDDKLTVAKTNELYDNVEHLRDVIFVDRKLEAENGAVVVGNSGLRNNTGFTGINEATGTTIQDGKELTLIGGKSDGSGNRFNLSFECLCRGSGSL
ncbi:hypothetical protein [Parasutterella sp.]|uniref:hypothetical protein n=1 Tax=Parasutterella sp. TaxID=2049037 RepID=UPI0039A019BC